MVQRDVFSGGRGGGFILFAIKLMPKKKESREKILDTEYFI